MHALQRRVCQAARQLPRTMRTYASDAHHKPAPVNEHFGKGSIALVVSFLGFVGVLMVKPRPGEESSITAFIDKFRSRSEDWADISAMNTKFLQQAGYDRNLFENASNKHRYVNLSFPEAFSSHARRNIQAGELINIDYIVEHYRQEHLKEEERKAKKLAQKN